MRYKYSGIEISGTVAGSLYRKYKLYRNFQRQNRQKCSAVSHGRESSLPHIFLICSCVNWWALRRNIPNYGHLVMVLYILVRVPAL